MRKKIFKLSFSFLTVFVFGSFFISSIFAQAVDTTPPIISLIGLNPVSLNVGDTYTDAGATALDDDDTDLTSSIITANPVDVEIAGTYTITYNVADIAENSAVEVTRTVNVNTQPEPDEGDQFLIEENIILKNGCEVKDADGTTHIFPKEDFSEEYIAICALAEALEQGFVNDIEFVDFGFGLFVNSINGISQENAYWKLQLNTLDANVGVSQLALGAGDVVSLVLTAFDPVTFEEEPLDYVLTLTIESLNPVFNNIIILDHCSVTDTEEQVHEFPQDDSPSKFLAICALVEAKERGFIEDFGLTNNPDFGLYVESINNIEPSDTEFWALWQNGGFADCGIGCLSILKGDTLSLVLSDWMAGTEGTTITLRIVALVSSPEEEPDKEEPSSGGGSEEPSSGGGSSGGGGSSSGSIKPLTQFDVLKAVSFLSLQQNGDGSFANVLISDWTAVALATSDSNETKTKLSNYLLSAPPAGSNVTDYERRAMALLSLGINPYSGTSTDYITPIVDAFDGTQIGELFPHDDIFAIFPLLHAGYSVNDEIIQKVTAYIVSKQSANGSWGDPDSTAAAVQALSLINSQPGVSDALSKAKIYLQGQQQSNGGFGNSFSTSWVIQAIVALGETPASWTLNGKTPIDYLAELQQPDGGVDLTNNGVNNRTWATAYAIAAISEKSWSEIMQSVSKPSIQNDLNISSTDTLENTVSQPPIESVVCPPGDLFNATTGQACSLTNETNLLTVNTPVISQNTNNSFTPRETSPANPAQEETPANDEPREIISDTLTANVEKSGNQIPLPITIGGIVILGGFVLTRFFKVII